MQKILTLAASANLWWDKKMLRLNTKNENRCYVIGEAGLNHNGELLLAKRLIEIAIETGCDAVKFQKRTISMMAPKQTLDKPFVRFSGFGTTNREVREKMELSKKDYIELRNYCNGKIDFIVTPFDIPALEFLDDLNLDAFKIAAHNNTDIPLLKEVAKRGKPVIVSLGMCNETEIQQIVDIFKNVDLTLLYCVSKYPVNIEDMNLRMIPWLKNKYGLRTGFSDHEDGIVASPVAYALGATVIEKHFTIDKTMVGFDHHMSINPEQLRKLVHNLRQLEIALSKKEEKTILPCELPMYDNRRRSLFAARDIKKGEIFQENMLSLRESLVGLSPRMISWLVGKKAYYDIRTDEPVTFGMVEI